MAETPKTNFNLADASLEDGTIDYYTLIQETPDADTETLRAKIQALYSDAQANRDHRNLNKRREYQTMLELLPRARMALLEPEKRARYNAYLASAQLGTAEVEFDVFMNDLLGLNDVMEEKTGLLGVQDNQQPRARVITTTTGPKDKVETKTKATIKTEPEPSNAILAAVGALIIGLGLGYFIFHSAVPAICVGLILGALTFVALNKTPRGGIRS